MTEMENLALTNIEDIHTLTEWAANKWKDRIGLVFDEFEQQLTYREINEQSNQMAHFLSNLGVQKGDRVAVMLKNRPEFPITWLALGKIGAIMVPVNIYYKELDAKYVLEHSEAKVVVTSSEYLPLLQKLKSKVASIEHIVSVDESMQIIKKMSVDFTDKKKDVCAETIMNIQYTSGTTGRPKGCMLSQSYWLSIGKRKVQQEVPGINEQDIMLTAQPLYYMDPQWNIITSLASGATLIVLDRFHPSTFWEKVRKYNVTFFYCLGVMPSMLLKMPESEDDKNHNVRLILCSGIPKHLHRQLEERWGARWYETFGMTETGGDTTVPKDEYETTVGTGCIGRAHANRDVRIVDDNGQVVPRGTIGELVLRGSGMMEGYYKNPQATEEVFRNGFLHTGDLAYMDEKGLIYYVGRKKEMIRRSGENISATEIEDALKLHPDVNYAAAIPVPDEIRGEEVKVYVVLTENNDKDEEAIAQQLIKFCEDQLAYYKIPRYWEFRKELPKTPSEKIAKHILRAEKDDLRINSYDRIDNIWRRDD